MTPFQKHIARCAMEMGPAVSDSSRWFVLEKGEPKQVADLLEWANWMEANSFSRHIADDTIGSARVSTVFLGLDHNLMGIGPPLLFETMVFGGAFDGEQVRYTTTQQAIDGHNATCVRVRNGSSTAQSEKENG